MITADDLVLMAEDIAAVIAERPLAAAFRRGATTLPAQTVRVFATGGGATRRDQQTAAAQWPMLVLGAVDLDVQVGDRFNDYNGALVEVKTIHNDRRAFTQAGADLVQ